MENKKIDNEVYNEVYAIFDPETNTYMSSFVVNNIDVAKRNFYFTKENLKKQCGEAEFIDKLELQKMTKNNLEPDIIKILK